MSNEFINFDSTKFNTTVSVTVDNNNNSNKCDIRTNDNRMDSFQNSVCFNKSDNEFYTSNIDSNINIYRYKFIDEFTNELYKFSKIHQYDHRKDFKEAWNIWVDENEDLVNNETRRLINLGYEGDILDKMFKSARYYFRKKSTEKKEPQKRRIYIGVQKDLLDAMDNHIESNKNNKNYKPSDGFIDFCKENIELLKEEVNRLCKSGIIDSDEIKNKIKKTYKNRYFMIKNIK